MTASDIVTVTVRVTAPKIEITNVEFSAVGSEVQGVQRSMWESHRSVVKVM